MTTNNQKPFGMKDKLGYMFGDFGNDFTFILASLLMMKFYTDVMGVSAALVGTLMMVARFIDAFTDVTMGQIVDRSKPTAAGKFKPWLVRICGPVAVASFLIYGSWFANMGMTFKIVYMFVTYILWGSVFYTAINIPYGSMASAISANPEERASLSTFRTMGGALAGICIGVLLPIIIYDKVGDVQVMNGGKVSIAVGFCSIAAILCYILCYKMCTERVKLEQKTEKFNFISLLKGLVTNKALIGIVLVSICMLLVQLTATTLQGYVFPDYYGNVAAQSVATLLAMLPTFLLAAVIGKIQAKCGRKELSIAGGIWGAIVFIIMYFMHINNPWVFAGIYTLGYCGLTVIQLICWAMITDVIDDTEVQTGSRSDGEIYSVYSFARKMGQAASSGVAGALLTMIGYVSGSTVGQTEAVKEGIYTLSCLVPGIGFLLLALITWLFYPLSKKRVDENVEILAQKRAVK
ncbi:MAG: MFS transporter [Lachnospiraceae bacterium]|nr:MFS transporter [Lachnospiraceae bacterium]